MIMAGGHTYFEFLPNDVLEEMFGKHYSWVDSQHAASLSFSGNSAFRTIVPGMLQKIELGSGAMEWNAHETAAVGTLRLCGDGRSADEKRSILSLDIRKLRQENSIEMQALNVSGASIRTIRLVVDSPFVGVIPVAKLAECCPHIDALEIMERSGKATPNLQYCNDLVRELGPRLRALWWESEKVERLDLSECTALRELTYRGRKLQVLAPYWRTFGSSLRKLNICSGPCGTTWSREMDRIQKSAKNLTHISVDMYLISNRTPVHTDKYASFLACYGRTLVEADTKPLNNRYRDLKAVARACPNVGFRYCATDRAKSLNTILMLASSLKELSLRVMDPQIVRQDLFRVAMKNCSNLSKLTVLSAFRQDEQFIEAIFPSSRSTLEYLEFRNMIVSQRNLQLIASRTFHLKILWITATRCLGVDCGSAFGSIFMSNPLLERFTLEEMPRRRNESAERAIETSVRIVEDIAASFSSYAPRLRSVHLDFSHGTLPLPMTFNISESLRDRLLLVCRRLRNRRVSHEVRLIHSAEPFTVGY